MDLARPIRSHQPLTAGTGLTHGGVQIVKGYPQGLMSKHIVSLQPGDVLDFKGPIAKVGGHSHRRNAARHVHRR